uniref:Putative adenylate cyclase type 10-like protein n=1 Tax=Anopheles triannulatus TaxID=58253 RepID=A0A2M4B6R1_9DIPT
MAYLQAQLLLQLEFLYSAVLFKVLLALFHFPQTFPSTDMWVLIIDDAEFIDDDSFELLNLVWRMPQIISVLAIGYQRRLSASRIKVFDSPHVCQVKLPPIETLLHKAIACQFLNVNAIPLDLER